MPDDATPPQDDKIPMTPGEAGAYLARLARIEARHLHRRRDWDTFAATAGHMIQQAYDAGAARDPEALALRLAAALTEEAVERMASAAWAVNIQDSAVAEYSPPPWGDPSEEAFIWDRWRTMMRAAAVELLATVMSQAEPIAQRRFVCQPCADAEPDRPAEVVIDGADIDKVTEVKCVHCGEPMTEVTEG